MKVTIKGQVTIPQNLREKHGITPNTEVEFREENGKIILEKIISGTKTRPFKRFRGIAPAKMSTDEIMALTRK